MSITKIATITVGAGGASSIDFTSIPGTFTDLMLFVSTRSSTSGTNDNLLNIQFNGSTSGYSAKRLFGLGSGSPGSDSLSNIAGSGSGSSIPVGASVGSLATANTFGNVNVYIPNYAGSTNKSVSGDGVGENNATGAVASIHAGLWSNTSAITSIKILQYYEGTIAQNSTATLYGVTKGSLAGVTVS